MFGAMFDAIFERLAVVHSGVQDLAEVQGSCDAIIALPASIYLQSSTMPCHARQIPVAQM